MWRRQNGSVRVTLQFHPDWPFGDGLVLEAIARDGRYRSQFETGTSNGGRTAFDGGDRWKWESRLFDGRYDGGPPHDRPVYGALNADGDPYGGSPRFGSAYFRLRPEVIERCTFCFPDSVFEPDSVRGAQGAIELMELARESGLDDLDRYVEATSTAGWRSAVTSRRSFLTRASAGLPWRRPPTGSGAPSNGTPASPSRRPPWIRPTAGSSTSRPPSH